MEATRKKEVNLIPFDMILRGQIIRRIYMWLCITLVVALLAATGFSFLRKEVIGYEKNVTTLTAQEREIEEKIDRLKRLKTEMNRLIEMKRRIDLLLDKRSVSEIFSEIEKRINNSVWLTGLRWQEDSSFIRGASQVDRSEGDEFVDTGYFVVKKNEPREKNRGITNMETNQRPTMRIQGTALSNNDLADFLSQLTESRYFTKVRLNRSTLNDNKRPVTVDFEIEVSL
jgi:Tfp pilus assembly protein PilN